MADYLVDIMPKKIFASAAPLVPVSAVEPLSVAAKEPDFDAEIPDFDLDAFAAELDAIDDDTFDAGIESDPEFQFLHSDAYQQMHAEAMELDVDEDIHGFLTDALMDDARKLKGNNWKKTYDDKTSAMLINYFNGSDALTALKAIYTRLRKLTVVSLQMRKLVLDDDKKFVQGGVTTSTVGMGVNKIRNMNRFYKTEVPMFVKKIIEAANNQKKEDKEAYCKRNALKIAYAVSYARIYIMFFDRSPAGMTKDQKQERAKKNPWRGQYTQNKLWKCLPDPTRKSVNEMLKKYNLNPGTQARMRKLAAKALDYKPAKANEAKDSNSTSKPNAGSNKPTQQELKQRLCSQGFHLTDEKGNNVNVSTAKSLPQRAKIPLKKAWDMLKNEYKFKGKCKIPAGRPELKQADYQ